MLVVDGAYCTRTGDTVVAVPPLVLVSCVQLAAYTSKDIKVSKTLPTHRHGVMD